MAIKLLLKYVQYLGYLYGFVSEKNQVQFSSRTTMDKGKSYAVLRRRLTFQKDIYSLLVQQAITSYINIL